jgi:hypothetical protein
MASRNKALALAIAILSPQNIAIAEEVIQKHFDKAMADKDRSRLRELSDLLSIVEEVKAEK